MSYEISFSGADWERRLHTIKAQVEGRSREELWQSLPKLMERAVEARIEIAFTVGRLVDLGEDLSGLSFHGRLGQYKMIAEGHHLPAIYEKFGHKEMLVRAIGQLPLSDQHRLVEAGTVEMVVFDDDGNRTTRQTPLLELDARGIRQVFDGNQLRAIAQQHVWLDRDATQRHLPAPEKFGKLSIDYERNGVTHRQEFIPFDDIAQAVRLLKRKRRP